MLTPPRLLTLGFDPGPTRTAWALVSMVLPRPIFHDGGVVPSDRNELRTVFQRQPNWLALVSIETVMFSFADQSTSQIILTSGVQDRIETIAWYERGDVPVERVTARSWRKLLIGKATPSDAEIAHVIKSRVDALPTRTNNHVRDAIGAAIGGALIWQGSRLRPKLRAKVPA